MYSTYTLKISITAVLLNMTFKDCSSISYENIWLPCINYCRHHNLDSFAKDDRDMSLYTPASRVSG